MIVVEFEATRADMAADVVPRRAFLHSAEREAFVAFARARAGTA